MKVNNDDPRLPTCVTQHQRRYSTRQLTVKWGSVMSHFYELKAGVRVLLPILFGIYIDGPINLVNKTNIGCKVGAICTGIFLYADDIILTTPSIQALQSLISLCELELDFLCMSVNAKNQLLCALGQVQKCGGGWGR